MAKIVEAAQCEVDFIQLREKDLAVRDLEILACEAARAVHGVGSRTRLLINSRTDVAVASQADGIHLRSEDISPEEVHAICKAARGKLPKPLIGLSCHNVKDVARAASSAATFAVFAPVFEKSGGSPAGLETLARACLQKIPVLALGGITTGNFEACLLAGAAGISGIRLFQENDLRHTVARLRKPR